MVAWTSLSIYICNPYPHTYNHKVLHLREDKLKYFWTHWVKEKMP